MTGRYEMGSGSAVEVLSQAIQTAERFPNLKVSHCSQNGDGCTLQHKACAFSGASVISASAYVIYGYVP